MICFAFVALFDDSNLLLRYRVATFSGKYGNADKLGYTKTVMRKSGIQLKDGQKSGDFSCQVFSIFQAIVTIFPNFSFCNQGLDGRSREFRMFSPVGENCSHKYSLCKEVKFFFLQCRV